MRTDPAIERYDRLMLRDLGSNPIYSWKWSEDLIHVMDAVSQGDGKPILDVKQHGSIYIAEQAKATRKIAPDLVNQWVICALIELNSEDGKVHGTGIAAWIPVRDRRSRAVCLPPNLHPNQSITEDFIRQVRRVRTRDAEELGKWEDYNAPHAVPMDDSERNSPLISRAEKAKFENAKLAIKDGFTAFGEEPGKRGSTSWPSTSKGMETDFEQYKKELQDQIFN